MEKSYLAANGIKDNGRILKLAISRSMSPEEVKITLRDAYSSLGMSDIIYVWPFLMAIHLSCITTRKWMGTKSLSQGCIYMLPHVSCILFTVSLT